MHIHSIKNTAKNIKKFISNMDFKLFSACSFIILASIFAVYNIHQYNRSVDNCEALLAEVHQNLEILHNELATLNASVNGSEVDYE